MIRRIREYLEWELRELREDHILRLGPILVMTTDALADELARPERRRPRGRHLHSV